MKLNKLFDDELINELNKIKEKIIEIFSVGLNDDDILLKESCGKYRTIIRKIIQYIYCPGTSGYDRIVIISKENFEETQLIKNIYNMAGKFNIENKDTQIIKY